MTRLLSSIVIFAQFTACAAADIVTWTAVERSVVADGFYAVTDNEHCIEKEIDGAPYLDCPAGQQHVEHRSSDTGPLAADANVAGFGAFVANQQDLTLVGDGATWTSDAVAQSSAGGAGSHWFSAGGSAGSHLSLYGELERAAEVELTAFLAVYDDNFADDAAMFRIRHVDSETNGLDYAWRVSCDYVCADLPEPQSISERFLLPAGAYIVEADINAAGGNIWDSPRVDASFALSFVPVPVPEPSGLVLAAAALAVISLQRVVPNPRRYRS